MPDLDRRGRLWTFLRASRARAFAALGLFLVACFATPLAARWLEDVPSSPVDECSVYYSHGPRARVVLRSGNVIRVGTSSIAFPERCIPVGTTFEKRRYELAYRVAGAPVAVGDPTVHVTFVGGALGLAFIVVAVVLAARSRSAARRNH